MLEPHQQADRREVQTGGGNGTVGTDQKAAQGLGFLSRQICVGILLPGASVSSLAERG